MRIILYIGINKGMSRSTPTIYTHSLTRIGLLLKMKRRRWNAKIDTVSKKGFFSEHTEKNSTYQYTYQAVGYRFQDLFSRLPDLRFKMTILAR